jgi:hypothetical protein
LKPSDEETPDWEFMYGEWDNGKRVRWLESEEVKSLGLDF